MPAYEICYLDEGGALTYKFSANCDDDHWATLNDRRREPAFVCSVKNKKRNHDERDAVDESCDDLEPVIAEGLS